MALFEDHDLSTLAGELVEVRSFGTDPRGELVQIINRHTKLQRALVSAVEAGERTRAEQAEQTERMIAAAEERLRKVQPTAVEWAPGGDDAAAIRTYGTDDGGLRMIRADRVFKYPNGHEERVSAPGFLTDPYPSTRAQSELQRLYLGFALAFRLAPKLGKVRDPWSHRTVQLAWRKFVAALERQPGELGRRIKSMVERAMTGGTGLGSEWVLSPQLDSLIRPYDLASNFMARITRRDAPGKVFDRPTLSGEVIFYRAGNVSNNNPSAYQVSDVTTSSITTTIKDWAARMLLDKFWMTDMAALVDPSELINQIRRGADRTLRGAVINGDTAGTHQDTLSSWTVGGKYSAGAMDGAASPYKLILGMRARAADNSATNDAGQTFSAAVAMASLERLGNRVDSERCAWLTNLHVLHTQIMPSDEFLTVDKIGPQATAVTGTMGSLLGRPLDVDEFVTNDLDGTTGIYDGSGDTTSVLMLIDYSAFDLWTLQDMQEFEVVEEEKGAVHLGATMRLALDTNCLSTDDPVSLDYDL